MLDGVNDSLAHARALAALLKGHPAKMNLIPFNPFPGTRFERPTDEAIRAFQKQLNNAGMIAPVRRTRGDDIDAACGQLKGQVMDRTRRSAEFRKGLQAPGARNAAA
jgi:23S rRNA (adenine2503-C2)-methyltransferase